MSATQLVLDLPHRPAWGRDVFFEAPANRAALAFIERWPDWPQSAAVLVGPAGAGKTHLAAVWQQQARARRLRAADLSTVPGDPPGKEEAVALLCDDAEAMLAHAGPGGEEAFFHLLNRIWHRRGALLMTARRPPARWPVRLRDLASRLHALPVIKILPPDDSLLAVVMVKQLRDRQLEIEPAVVGYVLDRIERSFAAVTTVVEELDRLALAEKRRITVPLARRVLAGLAADGDGR